MAGTYIHQIVVARRSSAEEKGNRIKTRSLLSALNERRTNGDELTECLTDSDEVTW